MFGLMPKNVEEVEKVICNGRERGKEGGKGERGREEGRREGGREGGRKGGREGGGREEGREALLNVTYHFLCKHTHLFI